MSACFHLCPVAASDGNPFEKYPQLQVLWSPQLACIAGEAIDEAFEHRAQGIDVGEIFLVVNPQDSTDVWGITGFLPWPDGAGVLERVGLRWHGLLAKQRGQGLSMAVLEDVRSRAHARYPMASHFVEFMPATPEHAATAGTLSAPALFVGATQSAWSGRMCSGKNTSATSASLCCWPPPRRVRPTVRRKTIRARRPKDPRRRASVFSWLWRRQPRWPRHAPREYRPSRSNRAASKQPGRRCGRGL